MFKQLISDLKQKFVITKVITIFFFFFFRVETYICQKSSYRAPIFVVK